MNKQIELTFEWYAILAACVCYAVILLCLIADMVYHTLVDCVLPNLRARKQLRRLARLNGIARLRRG